MKIRVAAWPLLTAARPSEMTPLVEAVMIAASFHIGERIVSIAIPWRAGTAGRAFKPG